MSAVAEDSGIDTKSHQSTRLVGLAFALEAIRLRDAARAAGEVLEGALHVEEDEVDGEKPVGNGAEDSASGAVVSAAAEILTLAAGINDDSLAAISISSIPIPLHLQVRQPEAAGSTTPDHAFGRRSPEELFNPGTMARADSPDVLTVSRNSDWLAGVGFIGEGAPGSLGGNRSGDLSQPDFQDGSGAAGASSDLAAARQHRCPCCSNGQDTVNGPFRKGSVPTAVVTAGELSSSTKDEGEAALLLQPRTPSAPPLPLPTPSSSKYLPSASHILAFPPLSPRSFKRRVTAASTSSTGGGVSDGPAGENRDAVADGGGEDGEDDDDEIGERIGLYPDLIVNAGANSASDAPPPAAASSAAPVKASSSSVLDSFASPSSSSSSIRAGAAASAELLLTPASAVDSPAGAAEHGGAPVLFAAGISNPSKLTAAPHYAVGRVEVSVAGEPFVMPAHFGVVEEGVYRCAFPAPDSYPFLERLQLKTIINFLDRLPREYEMFLRRKRIAYYHLAVKGNKAHCEEMDRRRVNLALALMMDKRRHPVLMHCRSGKHRTGAVVGCVRMLQGSSMEEACREYVLYCQHKQRGVDKQFIERFDPRRLRAMAPPREHMAPWLAEGCLERTSRLEAVGGDAYSVVKTPHTATATATASNGAAGPSGGSGPASPLSSLAKPAATTAVCSCACHSRRPSLNKEEAEVAAAVASAAAASGAAAAQRPTILGGGVFQQQNHQHGPLPVKP